MQMMILYQKQGKSLPLVSNQKMHYIWPVPFSGKQILSTEDKLFKKSRNIVEIKSLSPIEFITKEDE